MVQLAESGVEAGPTGTAPPMPARQKKRREQLLAVPLSASLAGALDERRFFILLPFSAIAGLCVSAALPSDPAPLLIAAGFGVVLCVLIVARRSLILTRTALLLGAAWVGFALLPIHGGLFGTAMLSRPAYGTYQARVDAILSEMPNEARVVLSDIQPLGTARPLPIRRARVIVANGPDLAPGDIVSGPFRFSPVPGAVIPGGFDTQFHAYFDGLGAYGNSTQPPTVLAPGSETPEHIIDSIRRGIAARIDAVLPQPAASIARAIINGDQSTIPDAARDTMATAGIAHVLSVSGLHLTIVAGGVFAALRMLLAASATISRRIPVKRVAAFAGIVAAAGYFAISGGNVAAFRSTLMIVLVFGAVLVGRRALTMRNVALAAIVVVATDPASVFRPSFQLSFAAVAALVGTYESLRREGERESGWFPSIWGYFTGITVTSLVAGAATLLFSVYHFQQTSPLGVLGNLATLPLVGFIMMPAALLSVLAMPFGIEAPFLNAMGWSIDRMLDMAAIVAVWSEHLRASPLLTPTVLVIGLAALCWFCFFRDRWRLLGPIAAIPLVLLFALDKPPDVLIADTTQAIAIRGPAGLELVAGKSKSFALDVWRETYAEPIDRAADVKCDSIACIGTSNAGFTYAIIADPAGFAEECGQRDLIITRRPAPQYCASGAVVDAADLAANGIHWLRWTGDGFEIRTAITNLDRAWRIKP
ncbi:MAG TPA: ComEC/Rec2 family competence protein [Devosia sp.]|nr:ComEC/Rec2 family competence protein [Devosia sp.]